VEALVLIHTIVPIKKIVKELKVVLDHLEVV
jgi:hypothetical protein